MAAHSGYLKRLLVVIIGTTGIAASINFLVDPYGLFGNGPWAGINVLKPASAERMRVVKPYLAERMAATTVIGGNSRPELGIDPMSQCWPASYQPVFNAGIAGASFSYQASLSMHASGTTATRILHGVDFLDFIHPTGALSEPGNKAPSRSPEERRLFVAGLHPQDFSHLVQRTIDRLKALFSLTTLADSFYTVVAQRDANASTRTSAGFNPARDYFEIIRHEGQQVLFAQKNRELIDRLSHSFQLDPDTGDAQSSFEALRRLIEWSKKQKVELVLFINPYHVEYLAILERSGKWRLFEEWKRSLVNITDNAAVSLWDFNTIDTYSAEQPPDAGDRRTVLRWFWEPAHYRSALGDVMLERMLATNCGAAANDAPFGTKLTTRSLEEHLLSLRRRLESHLRDGKVAANAATDGSNSKTDAAKKMSAAGSGR